MGFNIVASESMRKYLEGIRSKFEEAYSLAVKARSKGLDPEKEVDIKIANDIADRVEKLVGAVDQTILNKGLPERIRQLNEEYGEGDWRVALKIAEEVSFGKFGDFGSLAKNLEMGVRVGLAYITMAVTAAPLEGFVELKLKDRTDGQQYVSLLYAGPIRAAGGTAAAVSVLIADYLRKKHGLKEYDPTPNEIERYKTELNEYHDRVARLQYLPSAEEIEFLVKHIPVELNGDASTDKEVPNHKNLPRVETNKIRGGMCLVFGEGVALKAKKILKNIEKWGKDFDLDNWMFLKDYLKLQEKRSAGKEATENELKVKPVYKYLEEAVAGRPIFAFPLEKGGFRLRYGRSRLSGLGAAGIHPVTMFVMNSFIATGVQLRVERPGKACAITPCDSIEPPVVLLDNGDVLRLESLELYEKVKYNIKKILFNGDILFNYGDFLENNHVLLPSPYVEEWWVQELRKAVEEKGDGAIKDILGDYENLFSNVFDYKISGEQAVELSKVYGVPLYPRYLLFWNDLDAGKVVSLLKKLKSLGKDKVLSGVFDYDEELKSIFEELKLPHFIKEEKIVLDKEYVIPFFESVAKVFDTNVELDKLEEYDDALALINRFSNVVLRNKAPIYIGARLGRPEKAKLRKMKGRPQVLFPVGSEGGRLRSVQEAYNKGYVTADYPNFWCPKCKKFSDTVICDCGETCELKYYCKSCGIYNDTEVCDKCGGRARPYTNKRINIRKVFDKAVKNLGLTKPPLIKGVRGMSSRTKIPELMEKGILRAIHGLYVNKDGTIRYDAIEVPVTHFTPREIGTSIKKLRELGYTHDIHGRPLEDEDQVLELKPQDVILPGCTELEESNSIQYIIKIMNFVDDELEKIYGLPRYYNVKNFEDVVGHLIIGIAPHTSAGTIGRIIGFSRTQGYFAHPFFHSACRRNCDGDELAFILLLDGLLNFSRQYLPDVRGGRMMDAPLVITVYLDPNEIDSEAHNMDRVWGYDLEFYEKSQNFVKPYEVDIDTVGKHLGKETQLEGIGYTHPVSDMNLGVRVSAYKELDDMLAKITAEMNLAEKLVAVPTSEVATAIVEKHFLRDLRGNLRQYSTQTFRCVNCNEIYRRVPLAGRCIKCGGKLVLTVTEGSIMKYLPHSLSLAEKYDLDPYIKEQLQILKRRIELLFGKEPTKQVSLNQFMKK